MYTPARKSARRRAIVFGVVARLSGAPRSQFLMRSAKRIEPQINIIGMTV